MKMSRYSGGKYIITPNQAASTALEVYISEKQFLEVDESSRIHGNSMQHRVYSFFMPETGTEMIMKVFWYNPDYPFMRRLDIRFSRLFKDRCLRAYKGALALRAAGVNTLKPLAYWTNRTGVFTVEKYMLYEKIPAHYSLGSLIKAVSDEKKESGEADVHALIEKAAGMVRKMHMAGIYHNDVAAGNFLVISSRSDDDVVRTAQDCELALIDTDDVCFSRIPTAFLKRVINLKSLKRLTFSESGRMFFIKKYLGEDYSEFWWNVFTFWWAGRHKVLRNLRKAAS